ncbi:uncharacterized protein [Amphiura filiformis]|uniref:uncharacterized protein n=1 Tax=Amphiura filiformis TaxID=82378 RepID=UPI003B218D8F
MKLDFILVLCITTFTLSADGQETGCPYEPENAEADGQDCSASRQCTTSDTCRGGQGCVCDGYCGLRCMNVNDLLMPSCDGVLLPKITNGYWSCNRTHTCEPRCSGTFILRHGRGSKEFYTCDINGWYPPVRWVARCEPIDCGDPGTPANGAKIGESYNVRDVVYFTCNDGFELQGSSALRCTSSKRWSTERPKCRDCQTTVTPDEYRYQYVWPGIPVGATSFTFRVRASNDVHIALSPINGDAQSMYEIVIGGWGKRTSAIRLCKQCTVQAHAETPAILNATEYREFRVSFGNDLVEVSRARDAPFMSFQNTGSINVNYVGISTGFGSDGSWKFCGDWSFDPVCKETKKNQRPLKPVCRDNGSDVPYQLSEMKSSVV